MNGNSNRRKKAPSLHLLIRGILLLAIAGIACGIGAGVLLGGGKLFSPATPPPSPTPPPAAVTPTPAPTPTPEPTPPPYDYSQPVPEADPVEDEWFQDAVFIGDSRTDGLRLYGGITDSNFICYKGLTTFEFDNKNVISSGDKKITALAALKSKSYAKIYLMLGLNELGYSTEEFAKGFSAMLDQVREAQPGAVIYVQSVVPVNEKKAAEKKQPYYISNEKIGDFNTEIRRIAEEKGFLFLNMAAALTDETGELPYEKATDGIHFTKDWYKEWYAYLKSHTVDSEILEGTA